MKLAETKMPITIQVVRTAQLAEQARRERKKDAYAVGGAAGAGALLMYVLDPRAGKRRRALARDKVVKKANQTGDAAEATARDLSNRSKGFLARLRHPFAKRSRGPRGLQRHWSPTARLLGTMAGAAMAAMGASRRDRAGIASAAGGSLLVARALTNKPASALTGIGAGRKAVDVKKSIEVGAPVDDVYAYWSDLQNFPQFMQHVRDVRVEGDTSHWVVDGPAGTTVEFDAVVTRADARDRIAWKTVEGSPIKHSGVVRFERVDGDRTRVHVQLSYNPIAGAAGHAVALLSRRDPKHMMNDDLMRMKTYIEAARVPANGRR